MPAVAPSGSCSLDASYALGGHRFCCLGLELGCLGEMLRSTELQLNLYLHLCYNDDIDLRSQSSLPSGTASSEPSPLQLDQSELHRASCNLLVGSESSCYDEYIFETVELIYHLVNRYSIIMPDF